MDDTLAQTADQFLLLMNRLRRLGPGAPPPLEARVSPSLWPLVDHVAQFPGCGIQEMAKGLQLATPTVSIGARQLEAAGLVERQPDPQDGRAMRLFLTTQGQDLHLRTHRFRRQRFERLLAGLAPEERSTLLDLLERAVEAAERLDSGLD